MNDIRKHALMPHWHATLLVAGLAAVIPASLTTEPARAEDEWTFSWHASEITGLAITTDGRRLISTSLRDDRISRVVAAGTDRIGSSIGQVTGARSHAVAVSPDGKQVALAGFRRAAVFDVEDGKELWNFDTLPDEYSPPFVMALAYSPDGKLLATSGASSKVGGRHGYKGGLITIRDTGTGREVRRFGILSHASESIAFSPDGKLFAVGTNGAGGELPEPGEVRVWDSSTGELRRVWKAKESVVPGKDRSSASGIAFSPDSSSIAIASSNKTVRIRDIATGTIRRTLTGHQGGVRRVAYSADGRWLASAGHDRTVRIWDSRSGEQVLLLEVSVPKINAVVFSPDGMFLIAGGGDFLRSGEVRMWALTERLDEHR